jgi:hypothetical protein
MADKNEPETKRAKMADKDNEQPQQRKFSSLVHFFVIFVAGLIYYFIKSSIDGQSEKSEVVLKSPRTSSPLSTVNKGVCLFISDAASGVGRELALRIAATGVHVLAGKFLNLPLQNSFESNSSFQGVYASILIYSILFHSVILCSSLICPFLPFAVSSIIKCLVLVFTVLPCNILSCSFLFFPVLSYPVV